MPEIGYFHPQFVHFAVVLCFVGVTFRLISLTGKAPWTNQAAAALLIVGGVVAVLTAMSGQQAHGPVERIPGAAAAVTEHEEWGQNARNVLIGVALVELLAIAFSQAAVVKGLRLLSAAGGLAGGFAIFEAAEHGGELVYEYAGGPGIRSGQSADVTHLLVAGLYNQAMADRAAGDSAGAARLIDELARRMPNDNGVRLAVIESRIKDRHDAAGALADLKALDAGDDRRVKFRKAFLTADAYKAAGHLDSARAVLEELKKGAPPQAVSRIDQAIKDLGGSF
jgi:uncharacterized membrane protein